MSKGDYFLQSRGKTRLVPMILCLREANFVMGKWEKLENPRNLLARQRKPFHGGENQNLGRKLGWDSGSRESPPTSMWSCSASDQDECRWQLLVGWRDGDGMEK